MREFAKNNVFPWTWTWSQELVLGVYPLQDHRFFLALGIFHWQSSRGYEMLEDGLRTLSTQLLAAFHLARPAHPHVPDHSNFRPLWSLGNGSTPRQPRTRTVSFARRCCHASLRAFAAARRSGSLPCPRGRLFSQGLWAWAARRRH